ncbi:adenylosuccinate synthetase [Paenibacillus montanisoli]|uniref:Uncharacterized protein n=1 Tax=Paenibacillus montanisoli TaxID=2081970 RepID=A0A328U5K8_9BACL|nr:adenylosuccinate synthetase [Paenibacillus montanisoli]RAP78037.1 hypothetical protein DL346_06210 [Paenibacillus montanisoli]
MLRQHRQKPLRRSGKRDALQRRDADISGIRSFDELPLEAQDYIRFVEGAIGVPVATISVRPRREQLFHR